MAAEVFLLRHGETEWNAAGRFQGQLDSPLIRRGREQVALLGRTLAAALRGRPAPPLHVSPLGRTQDTAAIVARHVPGLGPAHPEPRLAEVTTGAWDGLAHAGHRGPGGRGRGVLRPGETGTGREQGVEAALAAFHPGVPWSARNQARMHRRNGDSPYTAIRPTPYAAGPKRQPR